MPPIEMELDLKGDDLGRRRVTAENSVGSIAKDLGSQKISIRDSVR